MATSWRGRWGSWARRLSVFVLLGLLVVAAVYTPDPVYVLSLSGVMSLSDDTVATVTSLEGADFFIDVVAASSERLAPDAAARDIAVQAHLQQLAAMSTRVRPQFVDVDSDRGLAQKLEIRQHGSIVVAGLGKRIEIGEDELFRVDGIGPDQRATFIGEPAVARAIAEILSGSKRRISVVQGHGERALDATAPDGLSHWKQYLESQGYLVKAVERESGGGLRIANDTSAVMVVGAQKAFTDAEAAAIAAYVGRGGALGVFVDGAGYVPPVLGDAGLSAGAGVAHDPNQANGQGDRPVLVYGEHPINAVFSEDHQVTILAEPLPLAVAEQAQLNSVVLLETSSRGWAERDPGASPRKMDPSVDVEGPVPVAVATMWRGPDSRVASRIVVVGDSDFLTNAGLSEGEGNAAFALNAARWLVGDDDRIGPIPQLSVSRRGASAWERYRGLRVAVTLAWAAAMYVGVRAYQRRRTVSATAPAEDSGAHEDELK